MHLLQAEHEARLVIIALHVPFVQHALRMLMHRGGRGAKGLCVSPILLSPLTSRASTFDVDRIDLDIPLISRQISPPSDPRSRPPPSARQRDTDRTHDMSVNDFNLAFCGLATAAVGLGYVCGRRLSGSRSPLPADLHAKKTPKELEAGLPATEPSVGQKRKRMDHDFDEVKSDLGYPHVS
ncbi:uncharacterized protein SCHCODRAFT_02240574 [Schizophyllum commune H4-8]|uniref:uncharacterized protein n=1 Tax=Schizophyllum commune (strain H4-8 / FGSC 9210) TaxID=578458 RepID=UPI00215DDADA|nr:uncharacterized protein SCHCODRAFT_02240574 [Schizophyllum commune H4-8]KAI5895802.1 hypothetical protein SCHCODRAFT_02240574 [Schizophyllum commune H4-8]